MEAGQLLERARDAFSRRDWLTARDALIEARALAPLSADDLNRLGDSVWWLGEFRSALELYEEAHHLYLQEGRPSDAAMCALGLAALAFMRGEVAAGSGWMSRGVRLLENEPRGAAHGYLLLMDLSGSLQSGELDKARSQARELQAMGRRFSDPNLVALGVVGEGQALIKQGAVSEGIRLLDEAMLTALSGQLAPEWAGNVYCQLMVACHELSDLQRAREWTLATQRWCESLSAAGPFPGICRVHRAQVFHVDGDWLRAETEAARVCEELAGFDLDTVAEGHYQVGEVRRRRGDLAGAEQAYRQSHACGRDPQPGLALLRLAQGRVEEAFASLQTSLASASDTLRRAWLCAALAEVAFAAGRLDAARAAADELDATAARYESPLLTAEAEQAEGALLLAEGKPQAALASLRSACLRWQRLGAPYECARTRVLLGRVYQALGDHTSADLEWDAATEAFRSMGARLDLEELQRQRGASEAPGGLSPRELEVLALVSAGHSNRGIAEALTISEKTVARHLTNIYAKLGIASRTEAARFAFEHGLVPSLRKKS